MSDDTNRKLGVRKRSAMGMKFLVPSASRGSARSLAIQLLLSVTQSRKRSPARFAASVAIRKFRRVLLTSYYP